MIWLILGGVVAAGFMIVLGLIVAGVAWDRYQREVSRRLSRELMASPPRLDLDPELRGVDHG